MRRVPSERSTADGTQCLSVFITARDRLALLVRRAPQPFENPIVRMAPLLVNTTRTHALIVVQRRK